MTYPIALEPRLLSVQQWWVLTLRLIRPTLRNGEVLTLLAAAVVFPIGFYIPLKNFISPFIGGMSSYAQYLTPLIVLNSVAFAAVSAAFRAATDAVDGINHRFQALPMATLTPLASRTAASLYRCTIAMTAALVSAAVIGFRFYGGVLHTAGFLALALLMGVVISLLADLIGIASRNPAATAPLMLLPLLIFGLMSAGIQPVVRFPDWIQPFVRNQPVTQFIYALRALAGDSVPARAVGTVSWSVIGPTLAWLVAVTVACIPLHILAASRRR